ncbi:MAG: C25 family cysteine peptidase, partial [Chloroflexota bacterium]|nr:C25 family cysteine peptidase [Chloroflexota bacterium]
MRKKFSRYPVLLLALLGASALFVSLTAAAPFALPPGPGDVEPLPEINPFARPPHAMRVAAPRLLAATAPITLPDPVWRIGITDDGLYRLTYAALEAAGVPTGTAPSAYHLSWRGQDVALEELGDALLFYAEKFHGSTQDEKYTDENVIWLTVDAATPGLRMTTRDVTPGSAGTPLAWITATARAEENLKYWARRSTSPGTDATWFWEEVNTPTTLTRTYPLTLTAPVTQGYTATLVVEVASRNYNPIVNPDHHLRVALNGAVAGETFWDGKTGHIFTVTVPAVALQDGGNDLQVTYLTDVGHQRVYFDRAALTYRRQPVASAGALAWDAPLSGTVAVTLTGLTAGARPYDVGDPLRPIALTGYATTTAGSVLTLTWRDTATLSTAYHVETPRLITPTLIHPPTDLLSPTIGADEIIIAPRVFCDAVEPLAERRRTQGLRVKVVAVEDVYDLFNGGVVHPEAIRAFVAYAHAHWPAPAPRYLLLAGDGHFNPKDYNPAVYGEFV